MPISSYLADLREKVGHTPILSPSVAVAVVDGSGRVLAGRHREFGKWVLPGGAVDPRETPADAAVREVWEETGLVVKPTRLVGVWGGRREDRVVYRNGDVVDYLMVAFEAEVIGGSFDRDDEEMERLEWLHPDELVARPLAPWVAAHLAAVGAGHVAFDPPTWTPPDS